MFDLRAKKSNSSVSFPNTSLCSRFTISLILSIVSGPSRIEKKTAPRKIYWR